MTVNGTKISEYLEAVPSEQFDIDQYLCHWNGSYAGCAITHAYASLAHGSSASYEDFRDEIDRRRLVHQQHFVYRSRAELMIEEIAKKTGLTEEDILDMEEEALRVEENAQMTYCTNLGCNIDEVTNEQRIEASRHGNAAAQKYAIAWFRERGL